jgi:hypothetical protein
VEGLRAETPRERRAVGIRREAGRWVVLAADGSVPVLEIPGPTVANRSRRQIGRLRSVVSSTGKRTARSLRRVSDRSVKRCARSSNALRRPGALGPGVGSWLRAGCGLATLARRAAGCRQILSTINIHGSWFQEQN